MANVEEPIQYPVHLGFWTNWSHGRIMGATITLKHRDGALLIAFLAIFVATTGTSFWRIMCFAIHQLCSSDKAEYGLYHQRQAILRNATNETTGLGSFIDVLRAWRQTDRRDSIKKMLPLAGLALISMSLFAAAGVFSSKIGQMGNEVLLSSPSCGLMKSANVLDGNVDSLKLENILYPFDGRRINTYANYVQRCYSSGSSSMGSCGPFVKSRIPSTVTRNASCPFDEALCRSKDQNIRLETKVDSHFDLGLNAPPDLRYTTNIITHCAPLVTEGHKETYNLSGTPYTRYHFGPARPSDARYNYTYEYEQRPWNKFYFENLTSANADYSIDILTAYVANGSLLKQGWYEPIHGLLQGDGDMSLLFLSANDITYTAEINDDWYSAHWSPGPPHDILNFDGGDQFVKYYMADEAASVLGCKFQYQACRTTAAYPRDCSRYGGAYDLADGYLTPTKGHKVFSWVWNYATVINDIISSLSISSLTSRFNLFDGVQGRLPDDQWQIDVENWHNIGLMALQGNMVLQGAGPGDTGIQQNFWRGPKTETERYFCRNQKILSTAYSNFSVLWLSVILITGILIITLSYTLVSIVTWIDRRRRRQPTDKYSRIEWYTNDLLQLQRLAHEELHFGTWTGCAGPKAVPITKMGELLAVIDMAEPSHPSLKGKAEDYQGEKLDGSLSGDITSPDQSDNTTTTIHSSNSRNQSNISESNYSMMSIESQSDSRNDSHTNLPSTSSAVPEQSSQDCAARPAAAAIEAAFEMRNRSTVENFPDPAISAMDTARAHAGERFRKPLTSSSNSTEDACFSAILASPIQAQAN